MERPRTADDRVPPPAADPAATRLPAIMRQVARLRITAGRYLDRGLAGAYVSAFRGMGLEFEEVRPYVRGDDIRHLDWNVTARTGRPHVKRFREERRQTLLFLVDLSGSTGVAGPGGRRGWDLAAELVCLLSLAATRNEDRVGLVLFSDRIEHVVPPRRGRRAALRLVRDVLAANPGARRTDLVPALDRAQALCRRHATVFLVSDFLAGGMERRMAEAARRHELVCCCTLAREADGDPGGGLRTLRDAETGMTQVVDPASARFRAAWLGAEQQRRTDVQSLCRRVGAGCLFLSPEAPVMDAVVRFLREREARRRHGWGA